MKVQKAKNERSRMGKTGPDGTIENTSRKGEGIKLAVVETMMG